MGAVVSVLGKILKYAAEVSAKIIYYWIKIFLPIFISISFFFYFIFNGIGIGLETGMILMFVLLSCGFALYIINGKELFAKIIGKLQSMFLSIDKNKKTETENNN